MRLGREEREQHRLTCGQPSKCVHKGPHPLLGLGVDELRWLAPVRSGDKLRLEGEVVELTPSKTKHQGVARIKWTAFNRHGDAVHPFSAASPQINGDPDYCCRRMSVSADIRSCGLAVRVAQVRAFGCVYSASSWQGRSASSPENWLGGGRDKLWPFVQR